MTPTAVKLRKAGIKMPLRTIRAAKQARLPLAIACGMLVQETGGGRNVFGHDPTICSGFGTVTQEKYQAYLRERKWSGNRKMQGIGPMQLTWWSTQDEADQLGGCWKPEVNMLVGFRHAAALIRQHGLVDGLRRYNGSGPAAIRYSASVRAHADRFARVLRGRVGHPRLNPKWFVDGDTDCDRRLLVDLARVARDLKVKVHVNSGKRSRSEQQILYHHYLQYGHPLAALPGHSRHETGLAADCVIGGNNIGAVSGARTSMKKHGLCLPVPGESWHVEHGTTWRG